ncbi:MAG: tyrosine protein kinase, partial [Flavobacteriales bacterium CG11_big_fil_rev_8_21_14_0_20_35_7]
MELNQQNSYNQEEESTINLREEFDKYLRYWKWFLLSVVLSIIVAFYYLRKTTPQYESSATIMIKDDKMGGGMMTELSAFQDLGILGDNKNSIDNEIEILKSRTIIENVIKELQLNVKYIREGHIRVRDYYNDAPIKMNFLDGDSILYKTKATFMVKVLSKTSFSIEDTELGSLGTHKFGQQITTPYGHLLLIPEFTGEMPSNPEVYISIIPLKLMVSSFREAIKVEPTTKKTSVINITLQDAIQKRAQDILNTLIKKYNEDAINDKNMVSKSTAAFIESRLQIINGELSLVETDAASYKKENKLTDIKSEATLFLENVSDTKKRILEANTQKRLAEFMIEYLNQNQGET